MGVAGPENYRLLIADVYELAGHSRRTSEVLARASGQTTARWHVLSVVSDGPRTVASAARRLGLARQSVQRVVDGLVSDGDLELRQNPDHARAPLVVITPEGAEVLQELVHRSEVDRAALVERAQLDDVDIEAARAVLRRLLDAFAAHDGDRAR